MKRMILPVIFIIALMLSGCTEGAEIETSRPTDYPTFEETLAMSDVELAFVFSWVDLTENSGAYYLDSADYDGWEPRLEEGSPLIETPLGSRGFFTSPYGEADIEEIALSMTKRYIHSLMHSEWHQNATFLITAYKDLSVKVYTLDELPEKYSQHIEKEDWSSEPDEYSGLTMTTWFVVPSLSYRFVGEIEGVGSGGDLGEYEWVTDLGGNSEVCLSLTLYEFDNENIEDDPNYEQYPNMRSTQYSLGSTRPAE